MHALEITSGAHRDIEKLRRKISLQDFERLQAAINSLANNPRPQGTKKLKGIAGVYRIRVGSYRVIYRVIDDELLILVIEVAKRSETTYHNK